MADKDYWLDEINAIPGLVLERVVKKNHVKLYLLTAEGKRIVITTGRTPSDGRGVLNFRADLRRFCRSVQ